MAIATPPAEAPAKPSRGKPALPPMERLERIPVGLIDVDHNVRSSDQVGDLAELVASIQANGVLQPIRVTPLPGGRFGLVYGQRRLLAAREAGLEVIPAVVDEASLVAGDRDVVGLVENLQRHDLNAMDEARALRRILDDQPGLTQKELGDRIGRSEAFISNSLRLLELAKPVQKLVQDGKLSGAHGKVLAGLPADEQADVARTSLERGWSSHQLEEQAKWAAEEARRRAGAAKQDAKDREKRAAEAVAQLTTKGALASDTIVVSGYNAWDGLTKAIAAAGYKPTKSETYFGQTPGSSFCDCRAWRLEVGWNGVQVHRHCINEKHRKAMAAADTAKYQAKQKADDARRQAAQDAFARALDDAPPSTELMRLWLWTAVGNYQRDEWAKSEVRRRKLDVKPGAGKRGKYDAWAVMCALTPEQLVAELKEHVHLYDPPDLTATAPAPGATPPKKHKASDVARLSGDDEELAATA